MAKTLPKEQLIICLFTPAAGLCPWTDKNDLHQFIVFIRLLGAPVRLSLKLHFADRPIDLFELLCFLIPLF